MKERGERMRDRSVCKCARGGVKGWVGGWVSVCASVSMSANVHVRLVVKHHMLEDARVHGAAKADAACTWTVTLSDMQHE